MTAAVIPRPPKVAAELRYSRTCYDHLAGVLGTWLHDRLVAADAIETAARDRADIGLAPALDETLADLGLAPAPLPRTRRAAYACLDWTERRHHLGGALGARICAHMLAEGWLGRVPSTRAVRLTEVGRRELTRRFGPLP